ncbi:MAG: tetratricopeptide repeat protein [Planctomycetes bacterium]|nr:tetratricopeptide repeat protein [Planctomycetota bacterium]
MPLPNLLLIFPLLLDPISAPQANPLEQAEALLAAGRFREAQQAARQALEEHPSPERAAPWWWLLAQACKAEGDPEEAAQAFRQSAELGPPELKTEAGLELAKTHLEMWDAEAARRILESLPPSPPGPPPEVEELAQRRSELLALCLYMAGREKEAEKAFARLSRKGASSWHYLGLIAFHQGDTANALERFNRSAALEPRDYYNLLYRGWCLLELNRLDEGVEAFRRLLQFADTPEAHQMIGRLEQRAGRFAEAEGHFQEALKRSPDLLEAQFGLATVLRRQGRKEEAKAAFERFQALHRRQEESQKKAYQLNQELQANPRHPGIGEALARHYFTTGDYAGAERQAWQALRANSRQAGVRLILARALGAVGRYREAAIQYQRLLRAEPRHGEAREELEKLISQHAKKVHER